jgi:MFS family permease
MFKFNKNILGFSVVSLLAALSFEMISPAYRDSLKELMSTMERIEILGFMATISFIIVTVTAIIGGLLSDTVVNRKPLLLFGYFLGTVVTGLCGFVHHWLFLTIAVALSAFGRGLVFSPRNALLADSTTAYGHAFGFVQACDMIGIIFAKFLMATLQTQPASKLFLISGVVGILTLLAIFYLIQEVRSPARSFVGLGVSELPSSFYAFVCAVFFFAMASSSTSLFTLRFLDVTSIFLGGISGLMLLLSARNISDALASYTIGSLSDTYNALVLLAACGFGLFGLMSFLLIFVPLTALSAILIGVLLGISLGTYFTLAKSITAVLVSPDVRGIGFAILHTAQSLGVMFGKLAESLWWRQPINWEASFISASGLSIFSIILLFWAYRSTQKNRAR